MGFYDKKYDLLVFGEPMVQYTTKNGDISVENLGNPSVGGEDVFVAITAAKHGLSVGFVGVIANDPYANLIIDTLKKHGVNTDNCIVCDKAFNGIEIVSDTDNNKREFFYNRPPGFFRNPISPNANKELIEQCRMVYASSAFTLSSPEARSHIFETFYYAHNHEISVALDPNLRLHRHEEGYWRETMWMLMSSVDFFSVSAASGEMQCIFNTEDITNKDKEHIEFMKERFNLSQKEIELDYRLTNMEARARDLKKKNVSMIAARNGGDDMFFAFSDKLGNPQCEKIPIEKLDNGFSSYSGAVFNGAFIAKFLRAVPPLEAAKYAAQFATQKCRLGNTLDSVFPASV